MISTLPSARNTPSALTAEAPVGAANRLPGAPADRLAGRLSDRAPPRPAAGPDSGFAALMQRQAESRQSDQRAAGQRASDQRVSDLRLSEQKSTEQQPAAARRAASAPALTPGPVRARSAGLPAPADAAPLSDGRLPDRDRSIDTPSHTPIDSARWQAPAADGAGPVAVAVAVAVAAALAVTAVAVAVPLAPAGAGPTPASRAGGPDRATAIDSTTGDATAIDGSASQAAAAGANATTTATATATVLPGTAQRRNAARPPDPAPTRAQPPAQARGDAVTSAVAAPGVDRPPVIGDTRLQPPPQPPARPDTPARGGAALRPSAVADALSAAASGIGVGHEVAGPAARGPAPAGSGQLDGPAAPAPTAHATSATDAATLPVAPRSSSASSGRGDAAPDAAPDAAAGRANADPASRIDGHRTEANPAAPDASNALAALAGAAGAAPTVNAPANAPADASAAPAEAHLPMPLHSPAFAPALGAQVSLFAADGVQTARLQINPAEMGPISVQIMVNGNAAQVDFQADRAATRDLIEAALPALASALQDAGLTLTGGGVSQQPPRQQAPNPQAPPDHPTPPVPALAPISQNPADLATGMAHAGRPLRRRGVVDLVA